jgi:hypothetical protein
MSERVLTRRRFLVSGAAATMVAGNGAIAATPALPPPGRTEFEVLHNGLPVGSLRLDMADRDGGREIWLTQQVLVTAFGVTLYAIKQQSHEVWSRGRLERFESETEEDDARFWVKGRAVGGAFEVQSRKERRTVPSDIMVATYWRPEICRQRQLLEPKRGRVRDQTLISVRPVTLALPDREVAGEEFRIRGILDGACVYDMQGTWRSASFEKRGTIVYRVKGETDVKGR